MSGGENEIKGNKAKALRYLVSRVIISIVPCREPKWVVLVIVAFLKDTLGQIQNLGED